MTYSWLCYVHNSYSSKLTVVQLTQKQKVGNDNTMVELKHINIVCPFTKFLIAKILY